MSLALHLGMTEEGLLRSMTEAELHRWMQFAGRHQLPLRRMELMFAQLSMVIARFASHPVAGNAANDPTSFPAFEVVAKHLLEQRG